MSNCRRNTGPDARGSEDPALSEGCAGSGRLRRKGVEGLGHVITTAHVPQKWLASAARQHSLHFALVIDQAFGGRVNLTMTFAFPFLQRATVSNFPRGGQRQRWTAGHSSSLTIPLNVVQPFSPPTTLDRKQRSARASGAHSAPTRRGTRAACSSIARSGQVLDNVVPQHFLQLLMKALRPKAGSSDPGQSGSLVRSQIPVWGRGMATGVGFSLKTERNGKGLTSGPAVPAELAHPAS